MSIDTFKQIVNEYDELIGRDYEDKNGIKYEFSGILWGVEDIYYMLSTHYVSDTTLVSCVIDLADAGYTLVEEE